MHACGFIVNIVLLFYACTKADARCLASCALNKYKEGSQLTLLFQYANTKLRSACNRESLVDMMACLATSKK